MTRKKREWYPGAVYHITTRGNHRNDIFRDEADYIIYLAVLKEALERFRAKLCCYCLMTNHVHLVIETEDIKISEIMKRINTLYTKNFNIKYNIVGHLFQGRYFSELIEEDRYMLEVTRYIHLNPIKANMVAKPEEYRWSSYSMVIGLNEEKIIDSQKILSYFKLENNRDRYRKFVESAIRIKIEDKDVV